jgi:two-component system, NarL family, captular synthesis response regulator RcsB
MFTKVLVVDDIDFNDAGAIEALQELNVTQIEYAKYCDEALLKIKKAAKEEQPYQLLISDLSFKEDHRPEQLKSGKELIQAVKELFPEIKIIVFSIEDKSYPIKSLFEMYNIDGYVVKGRNTKLELKNAIETVYTEQKFISPELSHFLVDKTINEIDAYDIQLIKQLSIGVAQENIPAIFIDLGITPSSKSTIEKRINKLKIYFKANNPTHLVAIAKDLGLI